MALRNLLNTSRLHEVAYSVNGPSPEDRTRAWYVPARGEIPTFRVYGSNMPVVIKRRSRSSSAFSVDVEI